MHRVIAETIRAGDMHPMERALQNLERWRVRFGGELPHAYREWHELLCSQDLSRILTVLTSDDEDAIRRRSNSPFTGIIGQRERKQIMRHAA